jgi:hypothetical protein
MSFGSKCPVFRTNTNVVSKHASWWNEWFGLGALKPVMKTDGTGGGLGKATSESLMSLMVEARDVHAE